MTSVLVTRPSHLAAPLIDLLKSEGYEVFFEPLLKITPLDEPTPHYRGKPAVLLTSRTTLWVMEDRREEMADLLDRPCYCIGEKTAAAAQHFGFTDIKVGAGNGAALAQIVLEGEKHSVPLLHIGGRDVAPDTHKILEDEGRKVHHWPVYGAEEIDEMTDATLKALRGSRVDGALFFSVRTAKTFVGHMIEKGLEVCCARISAAALSESVALALEPLPWAKVSVARAPYQEEMIAALARALALTDKGRR